MRQYIGNITIYNDRKVEKNPAREKLRLEMIDNAKKSIVQKKVESHLEEIAGKRDICESMLFFFDDDGNPPPNMSVETITSKYNMIKGQMRWIIALVNEMDRKLEELDPEQYKADKQIVQKLHDDYSKELESNCSHYIEENKININPDLRKEIKRALQNNIRAIQLREKMQRNISDMRIIGVNQISPTLRYLFAENMKDPEPSMLDTKSRYRYLKKEADWLAVAIIDLEGKLLNLREMVYASHAFMDRYGN
jgi:hypothetical protein